MTRASTPRRSPSVCANVAAPRRAPAVLSDVRQRNSTRRTPLIGPSTTGSRFSKNAVTPSTMSSVESAMLSWACRNSSASMNAMSCWRNIASLPSRMIAGDFDGELAGPLVHGGVELVGGCHLVDDPGLAAPPAR